MQSEELNASLVRRLPDLLLEWFPNGRIDGKEFCIGSVEGEEGQSLRVNINTGKWADFANKSHSGKDLISLYATKEDIGYGEAIKALRNESPTDISTTKEKEPKAVKATPVSTTLDNCVHYQHGQPAVIYRYRDESGRLLFATCRFVVRGGKEVLPRTFVDRKWVWRAPLPPRPLYGLDRLAKHPGKPVILVEGEKVADAAYELFQDHPVLSWLGGSRSVRTANWKALKGRSVLIWPDNDEPGKEAAEQVEAILRDGICNEVRVIPPPPKKPETWDLADAKAEGWTRKKTIDYIRTALLAKKAAQEKAKPIAGPGFDAEAAREHIEGPQGEKVVPLGKKGDTYYYHCFYDGIGTLQHITASGHKPQTMCGLAHENYWAEVFPSLQKTSGMDWGRVGAELMRLCRDKNPNFDPSNQRGRGTWYDEGRIIINMGNCLIVDGKRKMFDQVETNYIYVSGPKLPLDFTAEPLTADQAKHYIDVCRFLRLETKSDAYLIAGWSMLAPICGAFDWRPHLWLTGASGSGKTTVIEDIVGPLVFPYGVRVQSNTTEAGIRQRLEADALPVVFDEFEGETQTDRQRVGRVLELARQASTEGEGSVLKGTTHGSALQYKIRSSFMFSSIHVNLIQEADKNRFCVVNLVPPTRDDVVTGEAHDHYTTLKRMMKKLDAKFSNGLVMRAIWMIPVIRQNIEIFRKVLPGYVTTVRQGDQYSVLFAAAFALENDHVAGEEEAKAWLDNMNWEGEEFVEKDEGDCLSMILMTPVRISHKEELNIYELAHENAKGSTHVYRNALQRCGLRTDKQGNLLVAINHRWVERALSATRFEKSYHLILRRIPGAEITNNRYFAGVTRRAVKIPKPEWFKDDPYSDRTEDSGKTKAVTDEVSIKRRSAGPF